MMMKRNLTHITVYYLHRFGSILRNLLLNNNYVYECKKYIFNNRK